MSQKEDNPKTPDDLILDWQIARDSAKYLAEIAEGLVCDENLTAENQELLGWVVSLPKDKNIDQPKKNRSAGTSLFFGTRQWIVEGGHPVEKLGEGDVYCERLEAHVDLQPEGNIKRVLIKAESAGSRVEFYFLDAGYTPVFSLNFSVEGIGKYFFEQNATKPTIVHPNGDAKDFDPNCALSDTLNNATLEVRNMIDALRATARLL